MSKNATSANICPIWKQSDGPDHCPIILADPDVKIVRDGMSPGRTIGRPKEKASRNTIDYRDPRSGSIRRAEGTLEFKGIHQYLRDPNVVLIEPQFGPLPYIDKSGKSRDAYWDVRIIYRCGKAILVSFKPAPRAGKSDHYAEVQNMLDQVPASVCDGAALVTDRDLPAWGVANGRLIFSVLNDGIWPMHDEMLAFARLMSQSMTIEEFCLPFGGIGQTFRTAIKLIASHHLQAEPGPIASSTQIQRGILGAHHNA